MRKLSQTLLATLLITSTAYAAEGVPIDVHRDANCGCCKQWIKHLEANGFQVNDRVEADMSSVKRELGVPPRVASCHTAVIQGKYVEGHVPAKQIHELIARQDLVGIAVPGMPAGSPGMEMGDTRQAYQVIGLKQDGEDVVLADYPAAP